MIKGFSSKIYQPLFLWLMKDGPVYGYELSGQIEKMARGHIKISFGTVYPILRRMENSGLVVSTRDGASGRVYYELTPKGKNAHKKFVNDKEKTKRTLADKLLGFLSIYQELFGKEALEELLEERGM